MRLWRYLLLRRILYCLVSLTVKRAYGIRSAFVHGSRKELLDRDLFDKIVEYLSYLYSCSSKCQWKRIGW